MENYMDNVPAEFQGLVEKPEEEKVKQETVNVDAKGVPAEFQGLVEADTQKAKQNSFIPDVSIAKDYMADINAYAEQYNNYYSPSESEKRKRGKIYRTYMATKPELLEQAKDISSHLNVPVEAIISSPENFDAAVKMDDRYRKLLALAPTGEKNFVLDELYAEYPGLEKLKDNTDAAIALHNIKNVKVVQGIINGAVQGWESRKLIRESSGIKYDAYMGKKLTDADYAKLADLNVKQATMLRYAPDFLADPLTAISYGTIEQGAMMGEQLAKSQVYAIPAAAIVGTGVTAVSGPVAGAAAAKTVYGLATKYGTGIEMFKETVGNYYYDYKEYRNKDGQQLLTDSEARLAATIAAAGEAYLEVANWDTVLGMLKGGPATGEAKEVLENIVANAADEASFKAQLAYYLKNRFGKAVGAAWSEIKEEGEQSLYTDAVHNVVAYLKPGGDLKTISASDMALNAWDNMWQAVPSVIGMTGAGHVASSSKYVNKIADWLKDKHKDVLTAQKTAGGIIMIEQLADDVKTSELAKNSRDVYNQLVTGSLEGTQYKNVIVDTDLLLQDDTNEENSQIFYQLATAAGKNQAEADETKDNRSKLSIPVAKYLELVQDDKVRAKLRNLISFDANDQCFARIQQKAKEMILEFNRKIAEDYDRISDSINNWVQENVEGDQEKAIMTQILFEFMDAKEGVKEIRKQYEQELDSLLENTLNNMRAGMKQGVTFLFTDDDGKNIGDGQGQDAHIGGATRISNNDRWYSEYFKANKKAPSEKEMKRLAREALMGNNPYGIVTDLIGLTGADLGEAERHYADRFAAIDSVLASLDKLEPLANSFDTSELKLLEGLSKEGIQAYKSAREFLLKGNANVKKAAAASAILVAHHAEVWASNWRKMGYEVTALDYVNGRLKWGDGTIVREGEQFNQEQSIIDPIIAKQMQAVRDKYYGTDQWMKAPDGTDTQLTEEQWLYAHTDYFKNKYGDWETLAQNTFDGTNITQEVVENKIEEIRRDEFINDSTGGKVTFSKRGKSKIVSSVATRLSINNGYTVNDHYTAVYNTPQLFKTAILSKEGADKHMAIDGIDLYSSFCIVNKKPAVAVFTVKKTNNAGDKLYTLQLVELKNPAGILPEDEKTRLPAAAGSSTEIISQVDEKSKDKKGNSFPDVVYKRSSHSEELEDVPVAKLAERYKDIANNINEHGEPDFTKISMLQQSSSQKVDVRSQSFKAWFGDWENGEVPAELLDENGEPKVFYHQTSAEFDTFDIRHKGAGTYDKETPFGVFLKPNDTNIGLAGSIQMPLFVRMKNPIRFANRFALANYLRQNVEGYAEAADNIKAVNKEYKKKYEEAEQEDREFIQKLRASGLTRAQISEEYYKRKDATEAIMEEWEEADNKARAAAKELVDKHFRDEGYDGVILKQDQGSWGRSTETFIALNNNQVKSAVSNNGNFDINNANIYMQQAATPQKTLVAYHNITGQDLMRAIEFGGFPVPSIAIMKNDIAYNKYGEITLVGTRDMIDPKRGVPVYSKDGYTITFPKPSYATPKITAVRKFKDKWMPVFQEIDDTYGIDRITDEYKYPDTMVSNLRDSYGFEYYYLTKVLGKQIEIPVNEYTPRLPILKNEEAFNKLSNLVDKVDNYEDLDTWLKDIAKVVEEYYDERIAKSKVQAFKNNLMAKKEAAVKDGQVDNEFLGEIFKELEEYNKAKNNPGIDYRELKFRMRRDYSDIIYSKEYYQWADEQIKELVGEGKVKIGNKLYPFTLENVTKYMVKNAGAAAEASFNFSAGKVAALAAQKFKSIDEMHAAENKLGSEDEFNKSADLAKEIGNEYRTQLARYQKNSLESVFTIYDEAMEALAKASDNKGYTTIAKLRSALKKTGAFKDDIPDEVLQLGVDYLKALTDTTTQYFEAKPQRAINIGEFAGAVVPSNADPELVKILQDSGLMVETYEAGNNEARQEATQRIQSGRANVLFQAAGKGAAIANTLQLNNAMNMQAQGLSAEDIYKATGWYLGMDGGWRFDIPDNLDMIKLEALPKNGESVPLYKIYNNELLYKAYPWLAYVEIKGEDMEPNTKGYADGEKIAINTAINNEKVGETLIHEIQHMIQLAEEFAIGGNIEDVHNEIGREMAKVMRAMKDVHPSAQYVYQLYSHIELAFINGEYEHIDEAKKKYKQALKDLDVTEEEAQEINRLGAAYKKLERQYVKENEGYIQYRNLHGEQEARLASEKATLATELARLENLRNKTVEDLFAEWSNGKDAELIAKATPMIELCKKLGADDTSWTDEDDAKYNELISNPEIKKFAEMADEKFLSDWDYDTKKEEYDKLVLNGVNTSNAIVVFGDRKVGSYSYNQDVGQRQGFTQIMKNGQHIINVLETADQSTFMHEMAHVFYDDIRDMAMEENAPEQVKKDWQKLQHWTKWNEQSLEEYKGTATYGEFSVLDAAIRAAQVNGSAMYGNQMYSLQSLLNRWEQERFARGFEEYLHEGKAPTKPLQSVFGKFKKWLTNIYRAVTGAGAKPSKEVKEVMDRMIATQEEIDNSIEAAKLEAFQKQGLFKYLNGTSQELWERNLAEIREDVAAKVQKIAFRDMTEKAKDEREEKLKAERAAAYERISQEPIFVAYQFLQKNPQLSVSDVVETCTDMTVEQYLSELKARGGSLDAAVDKYMETYEQQLAYPTKEEIKAAAEEALSNSYYTKLATAFEVQALEQYARDEERLAKKLQGIKAKDEEERKKEEKAIRELDKKQRQQEERDRRVRTLAQEQKRNEKLEKDIKELEEKILKLKTTIHSMNSSIKHDKDQRLQEVRNQMKKRVAEAIEKLEAQKKELKEERLKYREWQTEEGRGKRIYRDSLNNYVQNIEKYAEQKMAALPIADATNPAMWKKMAENYSNSSLELFAKGQYDLAARHKRIAFFYQHMAQLAEKNKAKVEGKVKTLMGHARTMIKEKNVAANDRYLYNHLMYCFGLANKDAIKPPGYPDSYKDVLLTYNENLELSYVDQDGNIDLPDWLTGSMAGDSVYKDGYTSLNMEQMQLLFNVMQNIYKAGKEAKNLKTVKDTHGNSKNVEEAVGEIIMEGAGNVEVKPVRDETGAEELSTYEKACLWGNQAHVSLLKPETVLRQLGEKAMTYLYNPIKLASDREMAETESLAAKVRDITAAYEDGLLEVYSNMSEEQREGLSPEAATKKALQELRTKKKYKLGTSNLTKENVIALALNWGTELNRKRVLDGYRVEAPAVLKLLQELNAADWQMVINIWELFDDYWPRLVEVEANCSGVVLEKQEAVPFTVIDKSGLAFTIKGGYYPIKYDLNKVKNLGEKAIDDAKRLEMSEQSRLGMGLGNTKERLETVKYPLRLDFGVFNESLADTIHNICMRETVRDANRIVRDKSFEEFIGATYGNATLSMLQNWVLDCWKKEPQVKGMMDTAARWVREKQTMAALGFRTSTALLNVCNFWYVVDYLGGARAMKALQTFYAHPQEQYAFALEKSIFLRERAETMDRDMGAVLKSVKDNTADKITDIIATKAFWLITKTDLMLACPLWISEYQRAYQEAMDKKMTAEQAEREGVLAGDAGVRRVFGSGLIQDQAKVQKGSEMTKIFTMYYSFFSVVHNALMMKIYETRKGLRGTYKNEDIIGADGIKFGTKTTRDYTAVAKALAPIAEGLIFWMILPAAMEACIRAGLSGDDKDREAKNLAKKTLTTFVGTAVGGIPLLRDAVPAIIEASMGGRYYGVSGNPLGDVADQVYRVLSAVRSKRKTKLDVLREIANVTSNVTGLPKTMLDGMVSAAQFIDHGRMTTDDIMHYLWAIINDRNPDKK